VAHHLLGDAAKEPVRQAGTAVRRHHNHVARAGSGDQGPRGQAPQHLGGRGRAAPGERLLEPVKVLLGGFRLGRGHGVGSRRVHAVRAVGRRMRQVDYPHEVQRCAGQARQLLRVGQRGLGKLRSVERDNDPLVHGPLRLYRRATTR
jgi:hypothetical protein